MPATTVEEFFDAIPPLDELRERLSRNLRERELLRRIIRIAEQRQKVVQSTSRESRRGEG